MKIAQVFEFVFRNQHNHSEFAHFCLFIFLMFIFITFMQGIKVQLEEKISYQKRLQTQRRHAQALPGGLNRAQNNPGGIGQSQVFGQNMNSGYNDSSSNAFTPNNGNTGNNPVFQSNFSSASELLHNQNKQQQSANDNMNIESFSQVKLNTQNIVVQGTQNKTVNNQQQMQQQHQQQIMQINKAALFEQLIQEESQPEGFRIIREKPEYNAIVSQKDDVENPIFRIDSLIDKVTPKQLVEVLKGQLQISSWLGKQVQSKVIQTAADGSEIFSTIYKRTQPPLNNREVIHRRLINFDDSKHTYLFNYTTQGLENINPNSKQSASAKKKHARAYHALCGIVIRAGGFNEKGEVNAARIFYVMQMEFTGQYVKVEDQAKGISQYLVEFIEKLVDKAQRVKTN
eukprot:403369998